MKRTTLALALIGLAVAPVVVEAQTNAQIIERALAAAPARAREGAMVIKFNADQSYEVLKEGTNRMVCYDRSGEPGRQPFAVQCTSVANIERVAQNRRFERQGADRGAVAALVSEAEANGTREEVEYGSVFIQMNGPDMASARTHTTIAVPGATSESTGLPESGREGGAYIMQAGTMAAHIMIPGN